MRDEAGFDAFVWERSTGLLRTAYLLTGDVGHAEDLVQNTLVRVAQRWRRIEESPEAYARKIMMNLSRDRIRWLRRRPREAPLADAVYGAAGARLSTDGGIDHHDERGRVARALATLPVRQRQVVVLRFFEDLSVGQTAQVLGWPEGTVKVYTSRAIARLKVLLAEENPERRSSFVKVPEDAY